MFTASYNSYGSLYSLTETPSTRPAETPPPSLFDSHRNLIDAPKRYISAAAVGRSIKTFAHRAWKTLVVVPATAVKALVCKTKENLKDAFANVKVASLWANKGQCAGQVLGLCAGATTGMLVGLSAGPIAAIGIAVLGGLIGASAGALIGTGVGTMAKMAHYLHQDEAGRAFERAHPRWHEESYALSSESHRSA